MISWYMGRWAEVKINDEWSNELTESVEVFLFEVNQILKDELKHLRSEKKMTVIGLSRLAGVRRQTITSWLAGKFLFKKFDLILRIAKVLGVKIIAKRP